MTDAAFITLIATAGTVIVAYITHVYSKRVQAKKAADGPVDRYAQMFDGYERLIKQKDLEDERKAQLIAELRVDLQATKELVNRLEQTLNENQRELDQSRIENRDLKSELERMRREYAEMRSQEAGDGNR